MMTMPDEYINHGMNDVKVWHHGMTWHGDGTKCGKKWHFRGQKWAKKGVARGMAKLHRKIRLLECARGGVFGVARGGAEIAVFGDFGDGGIWRGLAFHRKWPERTGFCQNRPYCGRTKPRVRKQTINETKIRTQKTIDKNE